MQNCSVDYSFDNMSLKAQYIKCAQVYSSVFMILKKCVHITNIEMKILLFNYYDHDY